MALTANCLRLSWLLVLTLILGATHGTPHFDLSKTVIKSVNNESITVFHAWRVASAHAHQLLATIQESRSFRPLRIQMAGDSTMRQQALFLCFAINSSAADHVPPDAFISGYAYAYDGWNYTCGSDALKFTIVWLPLGVFKPDQTEYIPAGFDPHVVYFSQGLHALQLYPERPLYHADSALLYGPSLHKALDAYQQMTTTGSTRLAIFATCQGMCEENITPPYSELIQAWKQPNATLLDGCTSDTMQRLATQGYNYTSLGLPSEQVFTAQVSELCRSATFDNKGIKYLNHIAAATVKAFRDRLHSAGQGTDWLHELDFYRLTHRQCWASGWGDGRHFLPLVPNQVQAVLHVISSQLAALLR